MPLPGTYPCGGAANESPCLKPPSIKKDLVDGAPWSGDVSTFEVAVGRRSYLKPHFVSRKPPSSPAPTQPASL